MVVLEGTVSEELDPQALMAAAAKETGLDDFGDERFIEPMTRFLSAAASEGRLSPMGVMAIKMNTIRLLKNRLGVQADLNKHPEILEEDVSDPVVILGLARTGTTKLQRVMSRDPGVQGLWFWRILDPVPAANLGPREPDPRIASAQGFVDVLLQAYPNFMDGHPTYAEDADEEVFLMEMTFECMVLPYRVRVPSYESWWFAHSRRHPYEYLRTLLQYLQWQDGGKRNRPLVLKAPAHLGNLDLLSELFPKATVVHCHRDPKVAVASAARMVESTRAMACDDNHLEEIGDLVFRWSANETARNLAQRAELGNKINILDVQFADIVRDPLAVVRAVYTARGSSLRPEVESLMASWEEEKPHVKTHSYSLDRYGLTEEQIEKAFGEYIHRFVAPD